MHNKHPQKPLKIGPETGDHVKKSRARNSVPITRIPISLQDPIGTANLSETISGFPYALFTPVFTPGTSKIPQYGKEWKLAGRKQKYPPARAKEKRKDLMFMSDILISDLDPIYAEKLKRIAKKRGISRRELLRQIIANYCLTFEMKNRKSEQDTIYQNVLQVLEKNVEMLTRLEERLNDTL